MRKLVKYATGRLYRPLVERYLSKTREYSYKGIRLLVPPQVFHPGLFFSTRLLLNHILSHPLKGLSLLELGAGNGLISFVAAREGALVTAIDISHVAISFLESNSARNSLPVRIIHSDLFTNIPPEAFDIIAINPPFYKRNPVREADHAWYCGVNGEYFQDLFSGLRHYTHEGTSCWMILSEDCDLLLIRQLARSNGWGLTCVRTIRNWLERNYIFRIDALR